VGTEFNGAIDDHLRAADVVLLLVSPDFIASDYCYDRELKQAMERHAVGEARVIPVILRPCDWHDLPFGSLLAAPRDGKPITLWPNADEAFVDVVRAIKAAVKNLDAPTKPVPQMRETTNISASDQTIRSSNLRVSKQFTDLDKDRFLHDGFQYIAKFFDNSVKELVRRNPDLKYNFRRVDANSFAATVYRAGKRICAGSATIGGGLMGRSGIQYSMTDSPMQGGMNEAIYVKADQQALYFEPLGVQSFGRDREKLTHQGAAEFFWSIFVGPLQR